MAKKDSGATVDLVDGAPEEVAAAEPAPAAPEAPAAGEEPAAAPAADLAPEQPELDEEVVLQGPMPDLVVLSAPYGFIDDSGATRFWQPGVTVTEAEEIALLIGRKAPLDGIEYDDEE